MATRAAQLRRQHHVELAPRRNADEFGSMDEKLEDLHATIRPAGRGKRIVGCK